MTDTKDFATAFLKAQQAMRDPVKDAQNPHFRSRFVTLKGVLDAVRPALHDAGITVLQCLDLHDGQTIVVTTLLHTSGQSMSSRCPVICAKPNDPQALGSAITYSRRYAVAAICGVAPSDDDDDAEAAAPPRQQKAKPAARPEPAIAKAAKMDPFDTVEIAEAAIDGAKSLDALRAVWERVLASGFQGDDLARATEAKDERKAIMQGGA